jgi:hypothetical protein
MKKILILILILINVTAYSQNIRITKQLRQQKTSNIYRLQLDTTGNEDYGDLTTKEYVQYWVSTHGGGSYTNGYGLNLNAATFSVDTTTIAYKTWAAAKSILMSAGYGLTGGGSLAANRTFVVDSATLAQYFVRIKDSFWFTIHLIAIHFLICRILPTT